MVVGFPVAMKHLHLKCRISEHVTPQALLRELEGCGLCKSYFPKQQEGTRMGQAFLEFDSSVQRRRAHTKNESYIDEVITVALCLSARIVSSSAGGQLLHV